MTNKLNRKISIIGGAGNIGLNIAEILSIHKKICNEIVILDISENQAKGRAIDLSQGGGIFGTCPEIKGTSNFEDISNSDIIIIPAGMPRKPGMTREDLVSINLEIMKKIGENIKKYSPNSFIIVITNPLDIMVYALQKIIGCDKKKIVGMAGALDGARFSFQLSKYFGIGAEKISSMVIGAHNDSMVVLPRHSSICGIPVSEFVQN
jgi:malate dehydrogenase